MDSAAKQHEPKREPSRPPAHEFVGTFFYNRSRDDIAQVWASSRVQELIPTNEELPVDSVFLARHSRDSVSTGSSDDQKREWNRGYT